MMARVRLRVEVYATVRDVYAMHNGITAADGSSGEFEEWWAVSHRPTGLLGIIKRITRSTT